MEIYLLLDLTPRQMLPMGRFIRKQRMKNGATPFLCGSSKCRTYHTLRCSHQEARIASKASGADPWCNHVDDDVGLFYWMRLGEGSHSVHLHELGKRVSKPAD